MTEETVLADVIVVTLVKVVTVWIVITFVSLGLVVKVAIYSIDSSETSKGSVPQYLSTKLPP